MEGCSQLFTSQVKVKVKVRYVLDFSCLIEDMVSCLQSSVDMSLSHAGSHGSLSYTVLVESREDQADDKQTDGACEIAATLVPPAAAFMHR